MAAPPLSAGATQARSIWVAPLAVAVRPVGWLGAVGNFRLAVTCWPAVQLSGLPRMHPLFLADGVRGGVGIDGEGPAAQLQDRAVGQYRADLDLFPLSEIDGVSG